MKIELDRKFLISAILVYLFLAPEQFIFVSIHLIKPEVKHSSSDSDSEQEFLYDFFKLSI